jgi:hypothetical protein
VTKIRRRREQPLDDLKEKRGYSKLKEAAQDRNLWRTRLGKVYGLVVRQTTDAGQEWLFAGIQILLNLMLRLV